MEKYGKYLFLLLMAALIAGAVFIWTQKTEYERNIRDLQNKIAEQSVTMKVKDQVYEKLAADQTNLQSLIDKNTEQGKELADRLKETKSQVLSLSSALLSANSKLDKLLASQGNPDGSWTSPVDAHDGPLYLRGSITAGPKKEDGIRPRLEYGIDKLALDLVVSQGSDGSWKADAAVPPPVTLTFKNVHVNTYAAKGEWWKQFNFTLQMGMTRQMTEGLVIGGAGYKFKYMNVTGFYGFSSAGTDHGYMGVGVTYFPWER